MRFRLMDWMIVSTKKRRWLCDLNCLTNEVGGKITPVNIFFNYLEKIII